MKLYHATPNSNLNSILTEGLLPAKAMKSRKFVWLHTASRSHWAILHTCRNHGVDWNDVTVIEVEIPRSWVKSHKLTIQNKGLNGFWKCAKPVPVECFTEIRSSVIYAMSESGELG